MLWQPPEDEAGSAVDVDPMLTRWLRPHQREGTQFMFDCVCGLRSNVGQGEPGCCVPYGAQSSPWLFACTDCCVFPDCICCGTNVHVVDVEAHAQHQTCA